MRKISVILSVIFSVIGVHQEMYAQQDSFQDTVQRKLRYFAIDNPMWLQEVVSPRFTNVQLAYSSYSGAYHTAQSPQKGRDILFKSEGSMTLRDVRLWGRFTYKNALEDSTRFGHQTRHNPSAPFYFASYGYNQYERTDYSIEAQGQRYFSDNKWSLFAGLEYNIGDHFSNNDPRGSLAVMKLNGRMGLSYSFLNRWQLGVETSYGYGQENVEIAFRNDQYGVSTTVSPYLNYVVYGYGWRVQDWLLGKGMNYQNDQKQYGFSGYLSKESFIGKFHGFLKYRSQSQLFQQVLRNESRNNELLDYHLQSIHYGVLWYLKKDTKQFVANINSFNQSGEDLIPEKNGILNNYTFDKRNIDVNFLVSFLNDRWQQDYELQSNYVRESKKDGGSGTELDYLRLENSLSSQLSYRTRRDRSFTFGAALLFGVAPRVDWQLPSINENIFHQYVFYHDIAYYQATTSGLKFLLGYRYPMRGHSAINIMFETKYTKASGLTMVNSAQQSFPGNRRSFNRLKLEYEF